MHQAKRLRHLSIHTMVLEEQIQEEYVARRILELFDIIGEEGIGRWEIDKQVQMVKYES